MNNTTHIARDTHKFVIKFVNTNNGRREERFAETFTEMIDLLDILMERPHYAEFDATPR